MSALNILLHTGVPVVSYCVAGFQVTPAPALSPLHEFATPLGSTYDLMTVIVTWRWDVTEIEGSWWNMRHGIQTPR
jgi:hypothetical protein